LALCSWNSGVTKQPIVQFHRQVSKPIKSKIPEIISITPAITGTGVLVICLIVLSFVYMS